jgi:hypothetical protein
MQFACEPFAEADDLTCDCAQPLTDDERMVVIEAASDFLARISGGVFRGRCARKVRPVVESCGCGWVCYRCDLDAIFLPGVDPVVTEVRIDGTVLDGETYGVRNGSLIRLSTGDRPDLWPRSQKLWRPDTEDDTFSITIESGYVVDLVAKKACLELACELIVDNPTLSHVTDITIDNVRIQRDREAQEELEEAGYGWVARFLRSLDIADVVEVFSPEVGGGWIMHEDVITESVGS